MQNTRTPEGNRTQRRAKKGLFQIIQGLINKFFDVLGALAKLAWIFIEQASRLTVLCFSLIIKLLSSPTTPCIVAIFFFGAVCTVATSQWFAIGAWLGGMFGLSGIWGIGAGSLGVLLGVGLNIYQLAPQLWKLRRDIAEAYKMLEINPDHQTESAEDVKERLQHWLSMDHSTLKSIRLATYSIETGLVIGYCFLATGLNFWAIAQAAISLILPEKCLELVASTVAVLGAVSDKLNTPEKDHASF